MQPYFLPYIGYWQLINSVDKFVILDDVQYITKGWINRNKIYIDGKEQWITIPLEKANRNKLINELKICSSNNWKPKLQRTIEYNFKKSPNFEEGFQLFNTIINFKTNDLTTFLVRSIKLICKYLDIETEILIASKISNENNLLGEERILHLCHRLKAIEYVNLPGGKNLYDKYNFKNNNIYLKFIKENKNKKSILELIMMFSKKNIYEYLNHD